MYMYMYVYGIYNVYTCTCIYMHASSSCCSVIHVHVLHHCMMHRHVHCTCTLYMYIVHVHCTCTCTCCDTCGNKLPTIMKNGHWYYMYAQLELCCIALLCCLTVLHVFSLYVLQVYQTPFSISVDHDRKAVVLAIRGTLSMKVHVN